MAVTPSVSDERSQRSPQKARGVTLDATGPDRDRGLAGEDRGKLDVAQAERCRVTLVEDLQHADGAVLVDQRDGDDRARHVSRLLGVLPDEADVVRPAGPSDTLYGR